MITVRHRGRDFAEATAEEVRPDSCVIKPEILAPGTKITSCDVHNDGYTNKKRNIDGNTGGFRRDCTTVKQISADVSKGCKTAAVSDCQQKLRQKGTACVGLSGFSAAHALDIGAFL